MTDFDRAIKELKLGNYSEGMVILQGLLESDPENVDILYNLGMCYSEMGLMKKSIETLEKCVYLAPSFANALVALGFSYYQTGKDQQAMGYFIKALDLEPDNVYALTNIGALYNKTGQPDKALASYQKANDLAPGKPDILLGLGQAYELKEEYAEASGYFDWVRKADTPELIKEKAIEGLNRIAVAELKTKGQNSGRIDVIMHCLAAIELFSRLSSENIKEISIEIAMLGTTGLSINDPEKKYTLQSLEGMFSGMQLLCLMFAGFKIIDENLPPVADLEQEYQQALKIYRSRLNEH